MFRLAQVATHHVGPLSLTINAGECVCVEGASGSGKTLLLRALADLDPHQGEVFLHEIACSSLPAPQWRAAVTLVMAESPWWAERVGEHFPAGVDPAWLAGLGLPTDALQWTIARCSTGERQRLGLLRALMRRPSVLLLDEPTANLDQESERRAEALLADYRATRPAALLWVSHDERQAMRVAQRRYRLLDGRLIDLPT